MQPLRRPFRDSTPRALAGSLALHGVLALLLWQFSWTPAAVRLPEASIPIELRSVAELPQPRVREPETAAEPDPQPQPDTAPDRAPETALRVPPQDTPEPVSEPANEASAELPATDPARAADDDTAPIERLPLVPDDVDIEAAHRLAIARVVEALKTDSEFHTFSMDDVTGGDADAAQDPDGDGSDLDVFARAAELKSNGVAPAGRQRSRLARSLVDFCNQLTGGFSIFGLVNVCADPVARADLFGHLRPEYLESVPLCSAEEDLDIDITESATGAIGTFKCVLVPRAVREDFYSRYDPELAGWLPSEADSNTADD